MRKIIKIILAIIVILFAVVILFAGVIFMDLAAYTATGSQTLSPEVNPVGKALVVYDPGLSGAAKTVADKVATELQIQGYTVDLAGIKSGTAANVMGYQIIVAGGPIYAGVPTSSVKDFLTNLNPPSNMRVGVFGSGSGSTTPEDVAAIKAGVPALQEGGSMANAVVVKIGQSEDINARAIDLVAQLTQ
jgi:flavodoxin